ncbi:MAG TPA: hypothetical protein VFC70_03575 [Oscillospiraceae bacterium]|nr:hypothetical protein [Oscillospiraceae bacterium]
MSTICFSLLLNQGRYAAALPQECGVFALVLAGWCLVRFFHTPLEKHTIEGDSRIRRFFRIKQYLNKQYLNADLILFMLAVSLTIAYHFYTAIATCMLVLSFFGAYFFQTVKKQYWVPLVTAGILGVVLAVAPLMACYARGIPFQESMEWAMSVIRGEEWEGSEPEYQEQLEKFRSESNQGGRDYEIKPGEMSEIRTDIKNKSFSEKLFFYYNSVYGFFRAIISNDKLIDIFVICFALATVFSGSLFLFRKTRPEGSGYFAIVLYVIVIGIMGSAQALGIVKIFEFYRAMTFIEPFLGIIYTIPLDFIFRFLDSYKNRIYQRLLAFVSIILCTGLVYVIFQQGWVHDFFDVNLAYYNEPDYLVKHIRKTYKPRTFTIVSPVEEYYQVIDYGYHENISKFVNMVSGNEKEYKIPTQYVFFFIEKRILDDYYYGSVDVSPEYAQKDFIYFASAQDYYFQRAILESKAYYWALEFQKMYPNSFKVYFENDIYIAYILEQNPFSLYNLQIDYLPKGENE